MTTYASPEDSAPSGPGIPADAVWQPTIRARDLGEFASRHDGRIDLVSVDGVNVLAGWTRFCRVIGATTDVVTELVLDGPTRKVWISVPPDTDLVINVRPAD